MFIDEGSGTRRNLRGYMLISHLVPLIVSYFLAEFKNRLDGVFVPTDKAPDDYKAFVIIWCLVLTEIDFHYS